MTDEVQLGGKEYISSKRASELSGYSQDYIGQLARGGLIAAQRISGLWYISMESLNQYKNQAETYKPHQPERTTGGDPDSLISFDGQDYISAARASKIAGYHQDYVGQLARAGTILSRQVGNRWYVEREALLTHKSEKDMLLGAVQAQSVGISSTASSSRPVAAPVSIAGGAGEYLTYTQDDGALLPVLEKESQPEIESRDDMPREVHKESNVIPIRVLRSREILDHDDPVKHVKYGVRGPRKTIFYGLAGAGAVAVLTVVIVLSLRPSPSGSDPTYSLHFRGMYLDGKTLTASATEAFTRLGGILEQWIVPELIYRTAQ